MWNREEVSLSNEKISREEAIKRIGYYGKYAALTALGTYMMLNPKSAQATSARGAVPPPPDHFTL